jgi:phage major head subunit gpT-like protein
MAISRAQLLKELLPGLNALFGMEYATYGDEWQELYETATSDRSFEEEVKLSGFGAAPVKREGAGVAYDTAQEAWSVRWVHETIAMGFAITEEAMEDNLYDSLATRYTKAMARAMAYTKQVKAAAWFNGGFSGTTYLGGDGVTLFNTAHPLVGGGTNANRPTVAVDLNETSLENAEITINGWTDERGLLMASRSQKLFVPPQLQFVAERLMKTEKRPGTADNDVNAIKSKGTIPGGYSVQHFFTDPDAWFLKTDVPNGMKHFQRVARKEKMDGDFDTGNVRYMSRERYSFGPGDPLAVFGSPGA